MVFLESISMAKYFGDRTLPFCLLLCFEQNYLKMKSTELKEQLGFGNGSLNDNLNFLPMHCDVSLYGHELFLK